MKITEQENILIKKYLTHTLGNADKKLFKTHLKSSHFRKELLYQAKLIDNLEIIEEDLIRDEFKLIDKLEISEEGLIRDELKVIDSNSDSSILKTKKNNTSKNLKPIAFLIFILLVSAAAFFVWNKEKSNTNEINYQQFAESFRTPFPAKEYDRGDSSKINQAAYDEAMKLYAEGKYKQALSLFKSMGNSSPENQLYIANCYIGLKDYKTAKQILSPLNFEGNKNLGFNQDWYLLICEMGMQNEIGMQQILDRILIDPTHLFYNKSLELSKKLGK